MRHAHLPAYPQPTHSPRVLAVRGAHCLRALLGVPIAVSAISPAMMRLAGIFIPEARASVEMM
jgi:hypothetical protein